MLIFYKIGYGVLMASKLYENVAAIEDQIFIILGYWSQKNRYFYGFLLFLFTYFLSILFLWYGNWGWIT